MARAKGMFRCEIMMQKDALQHCGNFQRALSEQRKMYRDVYLNHTDLVLKLLYKIKCQGCLEITACLYINTIQRKRHVK